jgi:hypothetical protein
MDEIKINHNGMFKKFKFTENYEEFLQTVSQSYNIPKEGLLFNYIDEEGDKIVISTELDYNHIIFMSKRSGTKILKLGVENSKSYEFNKSETISCINSIFHDTETVDNIELKTRLKSQIHKEIDNLTEGFRNKLTISIDSKINNMLSKDYKAKEESLKCSQCACTLGGDFVYKCFLCEDVNFCKNCSCTVDIGKHIMIKYTNPDLIHIDSLRHINKKNINKFNFSNIIAFNTYTDKFVIDVEETEEDYQSFSFKLANMSKNNIQPGDTFECRFDESDIYGNRVTFNDLIYKNEDFEISTMFYSFRNKAPGFYVSKWNFVISGGQDKYQITFVFRIKQVEEMMPFQRIRKFSEGVSSNTGHKTPSKTISVPDLYSEIIKKHQENK